MCDRSQWYGDNAIDRIFCANFRNEFLAVQSHRFGVLSLSDVFHVLFSIQSHRFGVLSLSDVFPVLFSIQSHRFGFPVLSERFPVLRSNLAILTAPQIARPTTGLPVLSYWFPVLRSNLGVLTASKIVRPATGFNVLSDGYLVLFSIQNHLVFPTAPIQLSSFHSFRLTASQIVHPTTVGSLRISSSSHCQSWCSTNLSLLHSLSSEFQGLCLSAQQISMQKPSQATLHGLITICT